MKRLLAAAVLALVALCFGGPLQARERPDFGCHRVAYTPPGWGSPIEVIVCP